MEICSVNNSFGLSDFIRDFKEQKSLVENFLNCRITPKFRFNKSKINPFSDLVDAFSYLQDSPVIDLKDFITSSPRLYDIFLTKRNLALSLCCRAHFSKYPPTQCDFNYLVLGQGVNKNSFPSVYNLRQGRVYFPNRGIFSIHDSYLPVILEDLSMHELVYPIIDMNQCLGSEELESSQVVELRDDFSSQVIPLNKLVFCSNCGKSKENEEDIDLNCFSVDTVDVAYKDLLSILGIEGESLASLSKIPYGQRYYFLHASLKILSQEGPVLIVGLLRLLSSEFRERFFRFLELLEAQSNREIYLVDHSVVVERDSIPLSTLSESTSLYTLKPTPDSSIRFIEDTDAFVSNKMYLFLDRTGVRERLARIRKATQLGMYIGLLSSLKQYLLMHPVSKLLGVLVDDLNPGTSRYVCATCEGDGCEVCANTGLSDYLDQIELQGHSYREILNLPLDQVHSRYSFIREVDKTLLPYLKVGLGGVVLGKKVRDLRIEEFLLFYLLRDGKALVEKGQGLVLKDLFFDFGTEDLLKVRAFLQELSVGGEVMLSDKSFLAMDALLGTHVVHS